MKLTVPKYETFGYLEAQEHYNEPIKQGYQTLVLLKPDAIKRRICSKIFKRLEATDLKLVAMKLIDLNEEILEELYMEHKYSDFFPELMKFMSSGPVIAMIWEGDNAAYKVRSLIGNKHPSDSPSGTIRGDLADSYPENLIHGSDPWEAEQEIALFKEILK